MRRGIKAQTTYRFDFCPDVIGFHLLCKQNIDRSCAHEAASEVAKEEV